MSVSSHLTPEPERRLWLILESMRHSVESTDVKIAALTAFAAAEAAFLKAGAPSGTLAHLTLLSLSAALPLGVFAFSPLARTPVRLPVIDPPKDKPSIDDCLISADDLTKYPLGELIHRMDKYLGGGITATQYYEDLVSQIVGHARLAARKQHLFRAACMLVILGQLGLLGQLIAR